VRWNRRNRLRKLTPQVQNEEDSTTDNTDNDQIQLGCAFHGVERFIPVKMDRPRDRSSPDFLRLRGDILQTMHFAGRSLAGNGA